jgi:hypothetical protein
MNADSSIQLLRQAAAQPPKVCKRNGVLKNMKGTHTLAFHLQNQKNAFLKTKPRCSNVESMERFIYERIVPYFRK